MAAGCAGQVQGQVGQETRSTSGIRGPERVEEALEIR
jgi:hypothetical protein